MNNPLSDLIRRDLDRGHREALARQIVYTPPRLGMSTYALYSDNARWVDNDTAAAEILGRAPLRQPMFYRGARIIYDYELRPLAAAIRAVFHRPDCLEDWRRPRDEFAADGFELFV